MVIAVANWSDKPVEGRIVIDWRGKGIDPDNHRVFMPSIPEFQRERSVDLDAHLLVEGKKGFVIVLERRLLQEHSDGRRD